LTTRTTSRSLFWRVSPNRCGADSSDTPLALVGTVGPSDAALYVKKKAAASDGVSPLRYALIAFQYNSNNSVGPCLQNSRGWPSSPGALLFGCFRVHRSSVSKSIVLLIRGGEPAGILRIASMTCLGIGQGGRGVTLVRRRLTGIAHKRTELLCLGCQISVGLR
jgi:hypothetical protein